MAIAIGSPFRQVNSVTVGVVSGVERSHLTALRRPIPNLIQTDAALNPGNSGGPLLNSSGEVIGVTTAVQVVNMIQTGVGFAVPSDTVKDILPRLINPGEFKRPWLGVAGVSLTEQVSRTEGLSTDRGIYVRNVCSGSPADIAEIRGVESEGKGDVIVAVDDNHVDSVAEMVSYFNTLNPGAQVTLTVLRGEQTREVDVTLGEWDDCWED